MPSPNLSKRERAFLVSLKTMCQLEGCDRGGRDSAAELARAGGFDVNVGRLLQPADFGVSPDPTSKIILP
jgi:hypothetical protein